MESKSKKSLFGPELMNPGSFNPGALYNKYTKQAGAELGQAQLKLEFDLTLTVCRFGLYRFGLIVIIG